MPYPKPYETIRVFKDALMISGIVTKDSVFDWIFSHFH